MRLRSKFFLPIVLVAAFVPISALRAEDLAGVLAKLDAAAKNFHTTTASFEFDTVQTDPIPDTDTQTGTVYYQHSGTTFQMAAHITGDNGHHAAKAYIFSNGVLRESDTGKASDAKTYTQAGKYESYLMLGFGASGHDLEEKWSLKYLGTEMVDGVKTDKLELVAKDPTVRQNIPKVTIWLDTARAVSLKQVFDEKDGTSRTCHYTSIKVNQTLPSGAFSFDK
ncbi:MAG: outer membrane lipoprotein-sorting protein [Terracidiphilus sp.]|jgi:outer membrane lipoprotein-sorting protein